jgi:hypothetical protein
LQKRSDNKELSEALEGIGFSAFHENPHWFLSLGFTVPIQIRVTFKIVKL